MVEPATRERINKELAELPPEAIADVAQYVQKLKRRFEKTPDPAKQKLLDLYGAWRGEMGDEIAQVIEEGCEQVDQGGW